MEHKFMGAVNWFKEAVSKSLLNSLMELKWKTVYNRSKKLLLEFVKISSDEQNRNLCDNETGITSQSITHTQKGQLLGDIQVEPRACRWTLRAYRRSIEHRSHEPQEAGNDMRNMAVVKRKRMAIHITR